MLELQSNCQCIANMPKARALKNYKIVNEVNIFWRFVAVGNGSKIPLFDFFSAFAEGMSLRYTVIELGYRDLFAALVGGAFCT